MKLVGTSCTNMPWQAKPANTFGPVWRDVDNPIIPRNPSPGIKRIFNSAVVPFEGAFIGVFRVEDATTRPHLRVGHSENGKDWRFDDGPIQFVDETGAPWPPGYAYDPRVVAIDGVYYVQWCTEFHGPTIGLAKTTDFKTFTRLENAFLPFNRNGVLFPKTFAGKYKMLSRPSDNGHTPFGDIFISESPDLIHWGKHRHVMGRDTSTWWQNTKIGGGPAPIETSEGWLLFYHGVTQTCNGFVYSMGAALLDLDEPSKVLYRAKQFCLTPETPYEEVGFVPNVIFPCATLCDNETGRIAIYYGAADSTVALAYTTLECIIAFIKEHHETVKEEHLLGR
ncbi:MAG: glycosylase [Acholeplasmatales bacterium]|nr:MAG: glycosylase [Acholeplasmatales bacterium]